MKVFEVRYKELGLTRNRNSRIKPHPRSCLTPDFPVQATSQRQGGPTSLRDLSGKVWTATPRNHNTHDDLSTGKETQLFYSH